MGTGSIPAVSTNRQIFRFGLDPREIAGALRDLALYRLGATAYDPRAGRAVSDCWWWGHCDAAAGAGISGEPFVLDGTRSPDDEGLERTAAGACDADVGNACPVPEIPVCHGGGWICVGPASAGGGLVSAPGPLDLLEHSCTLASPLGAYLVGNQRWEARGIAVDMRL